MVSLAAAISSTQPSVLNSYWWDLVGGRGGRGGSDEGGRTCISMKEGVVLRELVTTKHCYFSLLTRIATLAACESHIRRGWRNPTGDQEMVVLCATPV